MHAEHPSHNAVLLSFGGGGVYASLAYERLLVILPAWSLGVKAGFGTTVSSAFSPPEISIPLGGYALYGKGNSKLDLGLSFTGYIMWQYDFEATGRYAELQPLIVPSVAYRFQKPEGGFIFRAGLCSMIHLNHLAPTYSPWIDLGVGYGF
jgi:hypothetical protein